MGNCPNKDFRISDIHALKPGWACAVSVRREYLQDKLSELTSGLRAINSNTIENTGTGNTRIEGARWSRGFTSGQHIIEFIYPVHTRGPGSRVGLGTISTTLGGNDGNVLVGGKMSWALDLHKKRVLQNGKSMNKFPRNKTVLPDWFFMYIDLDTGVVHFGSDGEYYGKAFTNVTTTANASLYPIVTSATEGAVIGIVYRGQGKEVSGPLRKTRGLVTTKGRSRTRTCLKATHIKKP